MVFFTCSLCGQSLKKNQVDKHCSFNCRSCESVTCVDCHTEFWGNDYKLHTKCLSEDQKYGGKDYKPKENSNKGEVKQEQWIMRLNETISTTQVPPKVSHYIEKLLQQTNIPRKKGKFENFVRNSMSLRDSAVIDKIWQLFSSAQMKNGENEGKRKREEAESESPHENESKRQKINRQANSTEPKLPLTDTVKTILKQCPEEQLTLKKPGESFSSGNQEIPMEPSTNGRDMKPKFKLTKTVKKILQDSPGKQLTFKKLKRKVWKEYKSHDDEEVDKETFILKMQQKLQNHKKIEVIENQIRLIE